MTQHQISPFPGRSSARVAPRRFCLPRPFRPHDRWRLWTQGVGLRPRPWAGFWPSRLRQRLPIIPIPLLAGDPDARTDLQEILHHDYDAAGYADSEGYTERDPERPYAYKYRDYVIRSHNANKPFDRFLIEQLAGDELVAPPYANLSADDLEWVMGRGLLQRLNWE